MGGCRPDRPSATLFERMAEGVRVRLGGEQVAFKREHREALRAMVSCVDVLRYD